MRVRKPRPVQLYGGVIVTIGLGVLGSLTALDWRSVGDALSWRFWLFVAFVLWGELRPIRVSQGDGESQITTSTTFAFALLLTFGVTPAAIVLALASVVGDTVSRVIGWKALFNAAQYTLAVVASGAVLAALDMDGGLRDFSLRTMAGIIAAGGAFFVVNVGLTGVAIAMIERLPLLRFLRQDLLFNASSTGVLIALSPIVVVAAERSVALIPLIALPMYVAYRTASVTLEKEHQAMHDALTGLPNRTLFYERTGQAILAGRRDGMALAVMLIDLDRFKEINDTLGHHIGDMLLKEVGPRLRSVLRESDTVARLGGDEFGVLLRSIHHRGEVDNAAERIIEALEQPFLVDSLRLDVAASIGTALFPDHAGDVETLVQRADVAMYVAKADHSGHATYSPATDDYSPGRLALVGELRQAVAQGQLVLFYQPKASLTSGVVEGVEALLRWRHPTRGLVSPDEFIPLAEQTGLIRPLTLFVVEQALRQCRVWHRAGLRLRMAVNLSARMLQDDQLPEEISRLLREGAVGARWLDLELTETTIMADRARSMAVLTELDALGISLSVDDFGTGYSSLAYLKRLPVDEIKIDKSFVMNMVDDENDAVIVRSTIELGRNLGLRVVAEGVESHEVWGRLRELGCDLAQGYYLSRPVPADRLTTWLTALERDADGLPTFSAMPPAAAGTLTR